MLSNPNCFSYIKGKNTSVMLISMTTNNENSQECVEKYNEATLVLTDFQIFQD